MSTVGAKIREAREGAGLTLEDLGGKVGVNWRTVSRWERETTKRGISVADLSAVAKATGKPLEFFVTEVAA